MNAIFYPTYKMFSEFRWPILDDTCYAFWCICMIRQLLAYVDVFGVIWGLIITLQLKY